MSLKITIIIHTKFNSNKRIFLQTEFRLISLNKQGNAINTTVCSSRLNHTAIILI